MLTLALYPNLLNVSLNIKNKSLMAFSKSGFTEDAIEYAKNNDIRLVSFEIM